MRSPSSPPAAAPPSSSSSSSRAAASSGDTILGSARATSLAPLVGGVIAVGVWRLIRTTDAETEALVAGSERE